MQHDLFLHNVITRDLGDQRVTVSTTQVGGVPVTTHVVARNGKIDAVTHALDGSHLMALGLHGAVASRLSKPVASTHDVRARVAEVYERVGHVRVLQYMRYPEPTSDTGTVVRSSKINQEVRRKPARR